MKKRKNKKIEKQQVRLQEDLEKKLTEKDKKSYNYSIEKNQKRES